MIVTVTVTVYTFLAIYPEMIICFITAVPITVQAWCDCSAVCTSVSCHTHLSTSKNNNSPHKLSFQNTMWVGDPELRRDLWP